MGGNSSGTVVSLSPLDDPKIRALKLALEKHGVRAISRKIRKGVSTVSRYLSEWVDLGYIVNSAPKGSVAAFERGPNLPEQLFHQLFQYGTPLATSKTAPTVGGGLPLFHFDLMPTIGGEPQPGFIPMRIHSLGHRFRVLEEPSKPVPWLKSILCSGVRTHILNIPLNGHDLEDERRVKIVYRDGSKAKSVEIWTPEVIITNPTALQEFDTWATARSQRVANWLSRNFGFKFGIVELCQDPHFAAAVPKEVARAAKEIGLKTPDLWCDNSRGRGDLETAEKKMASSLMELPYKVARLEQDINEGIAPTLSLLVDTQVQMVESFTTLNQYLSKLLGAERPPSEPPIDNSGGMFG